MIDDTGDRKDGRATSHVARQYLGSVGKVDNGIVAVTSLWAAERHYHPLHVMPYTPAVRLADGRRDAAFHTNPQIAMDLIEQAIAAGIRFQAIVSDCFYGENNAFERTLLQRRLPYVLARRGNASLGWAAQEVTHTLCEAAGEVPASAGARSSAPFLSRRSCGILVGLRVAPVSLWPRQTGAGDLRDDRSCCAARDIHLVPDDEFIRATSASGRCRASLRLAQLDRARLQADEE